MGGFGAAVLEALAQVGLEVPCRCLAVPDRPIEHGSPSRILQAIGLDATGIAESVAALLEQAGRGGREARPGEAAAGSGWSPSGAER